MISLLPDPLLELDTSDFRDDKVCAGFIDKFLAFQGKSYLREFKLTIDHDFSDGDASRYEPCLGRVVICESLNVSKSGIRLDSIEFDADADADADADCCSFRRRWTLPQMLDVDAKAIDADAGHAATKRTALYLENVVLPGDAAAEALISCSPVLEALKQAIPVCVRGRSGVIDTPKLEYLSLMDYYEFQSFEIISMAESAKADFDFDFLMMRGGYDLNMKVLYNLLNSFSRVGDVTMSRRTLQNKNDGLDEGFTSGIFDFLSKDDFVVALRVCICSPSLKSFTLKRVDPLYARGRSVVIDAPKLEYLSLMDYYHFKRFEITSVAESFKVDIDVQFDLMSDYSELFLDPVRRLSERSTVRLPRCLVSSLESVEMESPVTEIAIELKLARYFMKNFTTLRKLVLRSDESSTGVKHKPGVLEQIVKYSRRYNLGQFEVLPVIPTRRPWPGLGAYSSSVREGERFVNRGEEDRISLLPEPLLCHILSFLTTEHAVWTSVLSSRWRHIWRWVPRLEIDSFDFTNDKVCVGFIDKFLAFQGKPYLREFKLTIDHDAFDRDSEASLYEPCLGRVDMRKLERFQVENRFERGAFDDFRTPLTLSACEALVCLKLHFVSLKEFDSLSLPCLKIMYLEDVVLPSDAAAEELISSSPVLEVLKICLGRDDFAVALRVCSPSLKSFTLKRVQPVYVRNHSVVIDTPKLEYLSLMDYYHFRSFEITSKAESFKVDIDVEFELMTDYSLEKKIIDDLLNNFSGVKVMTMSWRTLLFINSSHQTNPLPKFHGLTRLRATMCLNASSLLLPVVLESCPNLKHLTLELFVYRYAVSTRPSTVLPRCLVSSLESVEMLSPVTEEATELRIARYFMKNSTKLKKLVLRLNQSSTEVKHKPGVLEQLVKFSRRYSLCRFEVLPVVPTPNPWPEWLGISSSSVREGEERVVIREEEDRISSLPEPLLCHILNFLTLEEAIWTSVLSSRWRHLWKWFPLSELDSSHFPSDKVCVDFIDEFLAFQGKSYLREFKLTIDHDVVYSDVSLFEPCLGRVDMRNLERFQVENRFEQLSVDTIVTPLTLSVCEALVCLKLHFVRLNEFESLSLPCLKIMFLEDVVLPSDAAAEALISSSPVLEVLKISLAEDGLRLRVRSPSLKSFTLKGVERFYVRSHYSVLIDAPKLEYLSLMDYYHFRSFKIISMADSIKVDIDVKFMMMKMKSIYNLIKNLSGVEDMTISWQSLEFIYRFHDMKPPPKFHGLTVLRATMRLNASPELLPIVLKSCPNLKHLTLELVIDDDRDAESTRLSTVRLPHCLVSSLESVEMESPVTEKAIELKLARYFMKNSTTLKKLVLRLNDCTLKPCVLEQLVKSSRRYGLAQFEVIPVVPAPNPRPEGYVYEKSRRF
ncbi:hypothetical protein Bca4012_016705 [Brassica carinata]